MNVDIVRSPPVAMTTNASTYRDDVWRCRRRRQTQPRTGSGRRRPTGEQQRLLAGQETRHGIVGGARVARRRARAIRRRRPEHDVRLLLSLAQFSVLFSQRRYVELQLLLVARLLLGLLLLPERGDVADAPARLPEQAGRRHEAAENGGDRVQRLCLLFVLVHLVRFRVVVAVEQSHALAARAAPRCYVVPVRRTR